MNEAEQLSLWDNEPAWADQWRGMPEFIQRNLKPWKTIPVHFACLADLKAFGEAIGQKVYETTDTMWFPPAVPNDRKSTPYVSTANRLPRYPVYIVSKGRWEQRITARALDTIGVPYRIVVEPQEYDDYAAVIEPAKILKLPFSNLGQGSIPARNWIWDHAVRIDSGRHWIMDDNIEAFLRLHDNRKIKVGDGTIFRAAEDFTDRYTNVGQSGFSYDGLVKHRDAVPPYVLNTRIYSCILLRNDLPFRWRGKYNEDTDLSLRILKSGLCTVQFNAFLAGKVATMRTKGGNTDELYAGDGRREMAESLREQHPDVVTVLRKFDRYQHQVNYRPFAGNKLILKPDAVIPDEPDDYGMTLHVNGKASC